jgi:hypothetical protein
MGADPVNIRHATFGVGDDDISRPSRDNSRREHAHSIVFRVFVWLVFGDKQRADVMLSHQQGSVFQ